MSVIILNRMDLQENYNSEIERLTSLKPYVIGLSVAEKRALYGIVDSRGNVICSDSVMMKDYPDPTAFVFDICDRLMPMIEKCGGLDKIQAMGIGASSGNNLTGSIDNPANLHWKGKIPLAKMFEGSLGISVSLRNDATASAMGERAFGAAHGLQNFICVNMDGGLGAGIFVNNHAVMGYNGRVGEIGHVTIFPNGRSCGCGSKGCLESYCSRRGIVDNAIEMMAQNRDMDTPLRNIPANELTVYNVAEAAEQGDELALETLRYTGDLLGKALVSVVAFFNPEAVIISGWVGALCGKYMQKAILLSLNEHLMSAMRWHTQVLLTTIDSNEAPLLYASAEAWANKKRF